MNERNDMKSIDVLVMWNSMKWRRSSIFIASSCSCMVRTRNDLVDVAVIVVV